MYKYIVIRLNRSFSMNRFVIGYFVIAIISRMSPLETIIPTRVSSTPTPTPDRIGTVTSVTTTRLTIIETIPNMRIMFFMEQIQRVFPRRLLQMFQLMCQILNS